MADPTGDLDNFFARKDKKKKGTQSGDKRKHRSNANKNESNAPESVLAETPNENDEWATIQDDISKSIMTIEGNCDFQTRQ